jgi:hypothetical protein
MGRRKEKIMTTVLLMLVAFQAKHFVVDYPMQVPKFFLGKFRDGWGFVVPLAAHAGLHAAATFAILLAFGCRPTLAAGLAVFNGAVHFVMDRIKAGKRYMGRWKPLTAEQWLVANADNDRAKLRGNALFWVALGFDQFVHHLTDLACVWMALDRTASRG